MGTPVTAAGDWHAVRDAVLARMAETDLTVTALVAETGLSPNTVQYFGIRPAHSSTTSQMEKALGWPQGHVRRILRGESPQPVGTPAARETPVMARLTRIERKLDALLAGTIPEDTRVADLTASGYAAKPTLALSVALEGRPTRATRCWNLADGAPGFDEVSGPVGSV